MAKEDKKLGKLFWIDMEMTGLDEKTCHILEAAAVVTDLNLATLDEVHKIVYQPKSILDTMDPWCIATHRASGLTREVEKGEPLLEVEQALVSLGSKHFGNDKIVLCGNSVGQDRKFIDAHMPTFAKMLHYRLIDISSFKEIFRSKFNVLFEKKDAHRARDDIFESIAELKHYLTFVRIG